ncbi:hypothetical protein RA307_19690 [Xanthobacteraceae bacterium Astr-EGSB]|uniref:hypothetical protein n=1 Tax=Astrobacterium formosum TaxID=3069710 RepID=UPI0027B35E7D|nr:hypothetical protein [Xanthobacteraceae bacterium Astr-EGSB]
MKAILSSLADFISAGLWPRPPLAEANPVALAVKRVVVMSMKVFWFSGDARPVVDDTVMDRVLGPSRTAQAVDAISPPTLSKAPEFPRTARTAGG